ncbi:3-deoxy-manno-octulosonate cytidylyltransferase [Maribellus sp. YY47]|uniref:3-deoxy-manno-octulosonate cytidylyltransferase n=1 Tax=Maribellus sp. YY47 TaxID=2929486 RepID=UPI002000ED77|nr:3-deoxy-manno-octulosonate cytidylyltransferase [Maribellus sp. YY47]MCK3685906.1 3-deoxy-manno-octulosonate cytidylyltransferase [Maribellus sp. YY47]
MKFIGIIPARYQSTRFPGKPLVMIKDKPMIQWVYENAAKALDMVCVATDDDRIYDAVLSFGGKAVKTLSSHQSGTDRCAEAARILAVDHSFDVVINIQGDEPFIQSEQIALLKGCFQDDVQIATLVKKIDSTEELFNPNRPKVVLDQQGNALYFSRSTVPYVRGVEEKDWVTKHNFWAHIGMYAFRAEVLQQITLLEQGRLELTESLEQLRWLENGYRIKTAETHSQSIGIDTPEDLEAALNLF